METLGIGAGLGAIAFWGFLAAVVGIGVWHDIRKREARHETLRRLVESGRPVDHLLTGGLLDGGRRLDRNLKAAGLILLFAAPGLALLGWFLARLAAWALPPLLGAAALAACIGVGCLVAAAAVARSDREDGTGAAG